MTCPEASVVVPVRELNRYGCRCVARLHRLDREAARPVSSARPASTLEQTPGTLPLSATFAGTST